MKYYLFAGFSYYPNGGMRDFLGVFDSVDDARNFYLESNANWYQITDKDLVIVEEN